MRRLCQGAGPSGRCARVGVARELLDCAQVAGARVAEGLSRAPSRMVGDARPLQAGQSQALDRLRADAGAAQTMNGDSQWR